MRKAEAMALRAGQAAAAAGALPILVGEANPYSSHPDFALYPDPPYSAGGRLCRLLLQMDTDDYLLAFERVNLCPSKWSMPDDRRR